jgi:hypothetical protein
MAATGLFALYVLLASQGSASAQEFRAFFETLLHQRLIATMQSNNEPMTPFTSDGCSAGMSKGWSFFAASFPTFAKVHGRTPPWEECCVTHDRRYHAGPPRNADAAMSVGLRKQADEAARQCIIQTAARREQALASAYGINRREVARIYRLIADTTYEAVRVGGAPCTGLDWRWGFGLPNC